MAVKNNNENSGKKDSYSPENKNITNKLKRYLNNFWLWLNRRKVKRALLITASVFVVLIFIGVIIAYSVRNKMLARAVAHIENKVEREYGWKLKINQYRLVGWSQLEMRNITLFTENKDTIAVCKDAQINFRLWPLIFGNVSFSNIQANNTFVDLKALEDTRDTTAQTTDTTETKGGKIAVLRHYLLLLNEYARKVPDKLELKDSRLRYKNDSVFLQIDVKNSSFRNENVFAEIIVNLNGKQQPWKVEGKFAPSNLETEIKLSTPQPKIYALNFVEKLASAKIGFEEVIFQLEKFKGSKRNNIEMKGRIGGKQLSLFNPRLSADTVHVAEGFMEYDVVIEEEKIIVKNGSEVNLNGLAGKLQANYSTSPQTVSFELNIPETEAQNFIKAIPQGMLENVRTMQLAGRLSYSLAFFVNLDTKDTISLNSDLEGYALKVTDFGKATINKLNNSFVHKPYFGNRSIFVGQENPNFYTLDQISPYVPAAVTTAEDPRFFSHKGFEEESFENSFIENMAAGGFRRGGSTISMQLMKNVFLGHQKTIDRKIEEAVMVWLTENLRIVSKNRMLEVYLNIIEWGPNVFGIGEASNFYFSKKPLNLSRNEAVFLATLIPRPRAYLYRFNEFGELRSYAASKMQTLNRLLSARGLAPALDSTQSATYVYISGPARSTLKIIERPEPQDTIDDDFNWRNFLFK